MFVLIMLDLLIETQGHKESNQIKQTKPGMDF